MNITLAYPRQPDCLPQAEEEEEDARPEEEEEEEEGEHLGRRLLAYASRASVGGRGGAITHTNKNTKKETLEESLRAVGEVAQGGGGGVSRSGGGAASGETNNNNWKAAGGDLLSLNLLLLTKPLTRAIVD